jgi:hypothetical protein
MKKIERNTFKPIQIIKQPDTSKENYKRKVKLQKKNSALKNEEKK